MLKGFIVLLITIGWASFASAEINIVSTTTNMGMLARTIAGDKASVRVMAPPDRDPHYLEARPNMLAALRRADLLVAVGAELEIGWLPAALQGAANPRVLPGRDGYFEGAAHIHLLEHGHAADRAGGDVHPDGNPHYDLDPLRMVAVGQALAQHLGELYPEHAETFFSNAKSFATLVDGRVSDWKLRAEGAPGVVLFHKDANYLMHFLDVAIYGYLEPLPGIPPTGRHLSELISRFKNKRGGVIHMRYQPASAAAVLNRELGWQVFDLPNYVTTDGTAEDYLGLIEEWVSVIEGLKQN